MVVPLEPFFYKICLNSVPKVRHKREKNIDTHIAFLAIYRLERHNQYNENTFLYQKCLMNQFQGSNKRKKEPLLSNTIILARF